MNDNNLAQKYNDVSSLVGPVAPVRARPVLTVIRTPAQEFGPFLKKSNLQYMAQIAMLAEKQKPFTASSVPASRHFHRDHF